MNKAEKAIIFLVIAPFSKITKPSPEYGHYCQNVAKYIIQFLPKEMERLDIKDHDEMKLCFPHSQQFLSDVALLEAFSMIEGRHAKQLVLSHLTEPCLCWDVTSAILHTKALDEADGNELLVVVLEAINANPKSVKDVLDGKEKALGSLLGFVMKKIKANPNDVRTLMMEQINLLK